eukprot:ANDGO_07339.mRNA.1 Thioredoxin-2
MSDTLEDWGDALRQLAGKTEAVQTLHTYVSNLLQHPEDPKFAKIRKGNPAFATRVAAVAGGVAFLRGVGFVDDGEFLTFRGFVDPARDPDARELNMEILLAARDGLQELVSAAGAAPGAASSSVHAHSNPNPPVQPVLSEEARRYQEQMRQQLKKDQDEKARLKAQLEADKRDRVADRKAHEGIVYSNKPIPVRGGDSLGVPTGVVHVDNDDQFEQTLKRAEGLPVILDFFAEWCGPCKQIAPVFERLAAQHAGKAVFVKVDVDQCQDIAKRYSVSAMPTFIVLKHGSVVDTMKGANANGLASMVQKHIPGS